MNQATVRHVENFVLGDVESVEALTRNKPGEVVSPRSYFRLMVDVLKEQGGSVFQSELVSEITWHFGKVWGPDDLKRHGNSGRPRWMNLFDFAKVMGRRAKPRILARRGEQDGESFVLIVLDVPTTNRNHLAWVKEAEPKKGFQRRCPKCRANGKLSAPVCRTCGYTFRPPTDRTHKLPE